MYEDREQDIYKQPLLKRLIIRLFGHTYVYKEPNGGLYKRAIYKGIHYCYGKGSAKAAPAMRSNDG